MGIWLRIGGWTVFAAGAIAFIANGAFENARHPLSLAAFAAMGLGMLLTGVSNVVEQWVRMRRRRRELEDMPPENMMRMRPNESKLPVDPKGPGPRQ